MDYYYTIVQYQFEMVLLISYRTKNYRKLYLKCRSETGPIRKLVTIMLLLRVICAQIGSNFYNESGLRYECVQGANPT